jgi:hypothetical protein
VLVSTSVGLVIGALAAAWGVVVALLDQPTAADKHLTNRLCTTLLVACTAAVAGGGLARATGLW